MAEQPPYPGTDDEADAGPDTDTPTGRPRWVTVSAIIGLAVLLVFVSLMLLGGGDGHGPGRHSAPGDEAPAPSGPAPGDAEGHTLPEGNHG